MREYLIDGNNLIHKIPALIKLQKKDRQLSREKLALRLESYFSGKNIKVNLFYDGYLNLPINTKRIRIIYSEKQAADVLIRRYIEQSSNPRNLTVVSSDDDILKLARACSADMIKSEEFAHILYSKNHEDEEKRTEGMNNDEFKKLFGADDK